MSSLPPEFGLGQLCNRRTVARLHRVELASESWFLCHCVPLKSRPLPGLLLGLPVLFSFVPYKCHSLPHHSESLGEAPFASFEES